VSAILKYDGEEENARLERARPNCRTGKRGTDVGCIREDPFLRNVDVIG